MFNHHEQFRITADSLQKAPSYRGISGDCNVLFLRMRWRKKTLNSVCTHSDRSITSRPVYTNCGLDRSIWSCKPAESLTDNRIVTIMIHSHQHPEYLVYSFYAISCDPLIVVAHHFCKALCQTPENFKQGLKCTSHKASTFYMNGTSCCNTSS